MHKYVITAQIKGEPLNSKIYLIGLQDNAQNLIIEKACTTRTVYFVSPNSANDWLIWAMKYLPEKYTYKIVGIAPTSSIISKDLKLWTRPIWTRCITEKPRPYILGLPFYFKKE